MNIPNRPQALLPLLPLLLLSSRPASSDDMQRNLSTFPNENGVAQTFDSAGPLDTTGPFFQSLGSNGRSCVTCHQPGDNWSITPKSIRARFDRTQGTDPLFRTNDGANCDTMDVSTVAARRAAYSQLLNKGLIRVTLPVPANAEFTVANVVNPYGCTDTTTLSVYRRPLPSTNLRFLTTVMWDGRESFAGNTLEQNLRHQANDATTGHAQGAELPDAVQAQIAAFEMSLTTAQMVGPSGRLDIQKLAGRTDGAVLAALLRRHQRPARGRPVRRLRLSTFSRAPRTRTASARASLAERRCSTTKPFTSRE